MSIARRFFFGKVFDPDQENELESMSQYILSQIRATEEVINNETVINNYITINQDEGPISDRTVGYTCCS